MPMRDHFLIVALCSIVFGGLAANPAEAQLEQVELPRVFTNLPLFEFPIGLTFANDGQNYLYVPEWRGRVIVFENIPDVDTSYVFLDLELDELGELYDVVFHPDYAVNGYVYVNYVTPNPDRTVIARYTRAGGTPPTVDPASRMVLLEIAQPNLIVHNGGKISFGPEGYLYIPLGDGGTPQDADGNAQNPGTLLGSVLRIDVDNPSGGLNYGIPPDNPFVGNTDGWREEVWAYGFRNPYSSSFDRLTGDLWLGDVGEVTWEEVIRVEAGQNYGWPIMEGPECFNGEPCDPSNYAPAFYTYNHNGGNASVIGGYVYRGIDIPELYGLYVFADFYNKLWAIDYSDTANPEVTLLEETSNVVALGEDRDGELYIPGFFNGKMFKVTVPVASSTQFPEDNLFVRERPYPNPFRTHTKIDVFLREGGHLSVNVYDVLGRAVATLFDGDLPPRQPRQIVFDGSNFPAGSYFIRVEGANEVLTRHVSLVK